MHSPIQYLFRKKSDRRAGRKSNLPLVLLVLLLALIQWTCEIAPADDTPATNTPATDEPKDTGEALSTIQDIISRKWKGVNKIPDFDFFLDAGASKTNCFSFTDVAGKKVTTYDWKSDIYLKNAAPQEVWFHSGNKKDLDSVSISSAGNKTAFYFILRYNVPDEHLDDYVNKTVNRKQYAVARVLTPLLDKVGKREDITGTILSTFKGYSLFMPIFARNIKKDGDKVSMELNFGITFHAKVSKTQTLTETEWANIFTTLKASILKDMTLISSDGFWTTFTAVANVENGAGGCPDNPRK